MKRKILAELLPGVRENCLISDARYWGHYSICGLLMRLREQYRYEMGIPPSGAIPREDIAQWIGRREALWEELQSRDFSRLSVGGEEFDPFDVEGINKRLNSQGLLYGAGRGMYLKPVFFLADLEGVASLDGLSVRTAGKEYARDLSVHPAMLQQKTVIARKEAAFVLIIEKFEEFSAMKTAGALCVAFESYGVDASTPPEDLWRVADAELESFVHHERGEAHETERSGGLWAEIISRVSHRRASLFLRGLKDTLADTSERGMLRHIIDQRKTGSLAFYAASLTGYRKDFAAGMEPAFREFISTRGWEEIESARRACYRDALNMADGLLDIYRRDRDPEALSASVERSIRSSCPRRSQ